MINLARNSIIICLFFLSACITHYHVHPVNKEIIYEKQKSEPLKHKYKFDLTDEERILNKNNEFLRYLETGMGGHKAIDRKQSKNKSASENQRKAVKR